MQPTPQETLAAYELALAHETIAAQVHALRTLVAIAQDLSNPKEARIAATAILKFKPPTPQSQPQPAADPSPQPTSTHPTSTPRTTTPNEPAPNPAPAPASKPSTPHAPNPGHHHTSPQKSRPHSPSPHSNGTTSNPHGNTNPPRAT